MVNPAIDWRNLPNMDVKDAYDWLERQIQNCYNNVAQAQLGLQVFDENQDGVVDKFPAQMYFTVTDELVKTSDGVALGPIDHVCLKTPVNADAGTPTVHVKHVLAGVAITDGIDDGIGGITGTNIASGSIDYATGLVSLTFTAAPDVDTDITISYIQDFQLVWTTTMTALKTCYVELRKLVGK